ncbi:sugar ABC transporter permease [Fictibacillus sp. 5RED26]|jgi:oligogalacturonide transport system permease protein|uniref:carbohydrate ABC transporter permease n=1 Tax=Fictibacillus TaxID=1329200 RepID=UPI0018CF1730|nr:MULTISPECIES: sugar ABC transporter permease [unclassified Fictibacillus]MBH0156748.1 sugar ABC transporter permease [Fictibacillus sp. 5RED26]MBH0161756.1 sugar ABC transporter permease [Fictibacillus sp. 26RED30]
MKRLGNNRNLTGLLFVSPWIIGFLVFTAFPLLYSLFLSFQEVKITTDGIKTNFVSFGNYEYAFSVDGTFVDRVLKYLEEMVISVPIIIVFSLIIALLLNQKIKFRGLFRTIFFLPVIIASGPVIKELIDQGITTIPSIEQYAIYQALNDNPDGFFNGILLYLIKNLIVILWYSGVQILIFLAALQKMDKQIFEAAKIDGASNWEFFWKITLPSLKPMIIVNLIYTIVTYSVFSLNPIIEHIQKNMFKVDTGYGYASALSWIYFLIIAAALAIAVGVMTVKRKKKYT